MGINLKSVNWLDIALKLPGIVAGAVKIADKFKVPGVDKKAAVIDSIPESEQLIEYALSKDVFNDPAIASLVSALVDAEAAVLKARNALKAGLLAKNDSLTS